MKSTAEPWRCGFGILPKHVFLEDFNKINFEFPVVSAVSRPELQKASTRPERRPDWWRAKWPKGGNNFDIVGAASLKTATMLSRLSRKARLTFFPSIPRVSGIGLRIVSKLFGIIGL